MAGSLQALSSEVERIVYSPYLVSLQVSSAAGMEVRTRPSPMPSAALDLHDNLNHLDDIHERIVANFCVRHSTTYYYRPMILSSANGPMAILARSEHWRRRCERRFSCGPTP